MLSRTQIAALLPHGERMCLLDSIISIDDDGIVCSATLNIDSHPLQRNGHLSSIIALEYGAQATGLWAALRKQAKEKPREGYVLAARNFKLHCEQLGSEGGHLTITVNKKLIGDDSAICQFAISSENRLVSEGQLTLVMRPAP